MFKHEIKVELSNNNGLIDLIEKTYFKEGYLGKISDSKKNFIKIEDDVNVTILNGLHNGFVKITNEDVIDGTLRFLIDESENEIRLYPISIYCIKMDENRYSFY